MRPAVPKRHLLSAFVRAGAASRLSRLLADAPVADAARLRSCGGPTAGTSFICRMGCDPAVRYADQ
eukprot:1524978-Alexandrium_andersonii.AAC.1